MKNPKPETRNLIQVQAFELLLLLLILTGCAFPARAQDRPPRQATDAEVSTAADVKAYVNPRQAQSIGGATNGQSASQVATLINDTNVNRIQPVVDAKIVTATNNLNASKLTQGTIPVARINTGLFTGVNTLATSQNSTGTIAGFDPTTGALVTPTPAIGWDSVGFFGNGSHLTGIGGGTATNPPTVTGDSNITVTATQNPNGGTNYALGLSTNVPPASNYVHVVGAITAGQGLFLVGTNDAAGSPVAVPTNLWPISAGGSQSPLATNVNGAQFQITNLLALQIHTNISGNHAIYSLETGSANDAVGGGPLSPVLKVAPKGDLLYAGLAANTILAVGNGYGGTYEGALISSVNGVYTIIQSNLLTTGIGIFNGGNSNYMGGSSVITNLWTSTNTAPTSVTVGTTAPDKWVEVRDLIGNLYKMPVWTNH